VNFHGFCCSKYVGDKSRRTTSIPAEPIVAVDTETAQTVAQIDPIKMQPHTPGEKLRQSLEGNL